MKIARLFILIISIIGIAFASSGTTQAQIGDNFCNPLPIGEIPPFAFTISDDNIGFNNEPDLFADCGGGIASKWYVFQLPPGYTNLRIRLEPETGTSGSFEIALFDTTVCPLAPSAAFIPFTDRCGTPGSDVILNTIGLTCLPDVERILLKVSGAMGMYSLEFEALTPTCFDGCENGFETGVDSSDPVILVSSADSTICSGDAVFLQVENPANYSTIFWVGLGLSTSTVVVTEPKTYQVITQDLFGCLGTSLVELKFSSECIWPGDADTDGKVDSKDILPIGLIYNSTGPIRNAVLDPLAWTGQAGDDWSFGLPGIYNGINAKHADADGSGVIDHGDVFALELNYDSLRADFFFPRLSGFSDGPSLRGLGDPPLFFEFQEDSFEVGDTITGVVHVGDGIDVVVDLYGISFDINLPMGLLDSSFFQYSFDTSWLNDDGNVDTTLTFSPQTGSVDVGYTRTDQIARTGSGPIMTFDVIVVDNLDGRVEKTRQLPFFFQDDLAIDNGGDSVFINPLTDTLLVSQFCDSEGLSTAEEYIDGFKINSKKILSGDDNGYDFTMVTAGNLEAGNIYNFGFKPGFYGPAHDMHWRLWLDINIDGDFDDPGEMLLDRVSSVIFFDNVMLPDTATLGWTTLRIQMKSADGVAPEACMNIDSGEVEDFFVEMKNDFARIANPESQLLLHPNPSQGKVEISAPGGEFEGIVRIEVLNLSGAILYAGNVEEGDLVHRLNLSALDNGIYLIKAWTLGQIISGKLVIMH
ncbi:MAG: hypothetical protein ACI959_001197 [Limisphaerales bacterium]|jgi:hypothetical protein